MGYAKYIGRVGGLAVALGVGIAVATTPAVAWADDTGSAGSGDTTGTAGATDTSRTSESEGTSTTTGTTTGATGASTVGGSQTDGASAPESGAVDASQSSTSASTDASVRQVPPGMVLATGGADSSSKSSSQTPAPGDVGAASTLDDSTPPKRVADSTATEPEAPATAKAPVSGRRGGSDKRQRPVDEPTGAPGLDASAVTATAGAPPSRPQPSGLAGTVVDVAVHQPAAPQAVTAAAARTFSAPQTGVVARQAISAAPAEPTPPGSPVSEVVLGVLASLDPLAPNSPTTPVDSPVGLAMLAVGARRQFGQPAAEETQGLAVSSALTSESIDGEQTFAATLMATETNSVPTVPFAQPVGRHDATGMVTGTVIADDPEKDTLTYTVTGQPTYGTVTLNSATGAYTYTPTQATRLDAYTTSTIDTDTFTVAVSDGKQTVTTPVTVNVKPARYENQAPTATVGTNPTAVVLSADGSRMYVANTGSNTVSVINTATGQRIDANPSSSSMDIAVEKSPSALALSADGKRLYVANSGSNSVSVIGINATPTSTTYTRVDANPSSSSTDIAVGSAPSALALSADGTRLYVANRTGNSVSVIGINATPTSTTYTRVDANPSSSSTDIAVGSAPSALALSADDTRLYVANRSSNSVSQIRINAAANTYVRTDLAVGGSPSALTLGAPAADGTQRLYVTNTGSGSGSVSVINANATSLQRIDANPTSTSMDIPVGPSPTSVALTPDGSLAYVANSDDTVTVIKTGNYAVFATVTIDTAAETGAHAIALRPDGTRLHITDAFDRTVRVLDLITVNTAPVVPGDTIPSGADPVTGAVTGRMNVDDPDDDRLTYTLTAPPAKGGTVTFNQQTETFTYTPSQAARDQAAGTPGLDYDTFGVTASDGIATTFTPVEVQVAPTPPASAPVTIAPVTAGSGPSGSAVSGNPAVSGNHTYVINYDSNNVTVINTATNQVVKTLDVGAGPLSVAASPGGNRVYVSNSLSNSVSVINSSTREVVGRPIEIQVQPGSFINPWDGETVIEYPNRVTEIAASGNRLYVNATDGNVYVIDTTNDANRIIRTAPVGTFSDLKVSPDGTRLYGTSGTGLTVINTATMTAVGVNVGPTWDHDSLRSEYTNSVGNVAVSPDPDGKRAYVTYGATIVERAVGGQSSGYFITDAQGRTWMVTGGYSAVSVIDTEPGSVNHNKEIARIIVPLGVQDVAVSGSNVYVTSGDGKTVTVINRANNALVGTFTTDQTSSGGRAIYLPDDWYPLYNVAAFTRYITVGQNDTLYITDYTDGTVYVVTVGDPTVL